MFEPKYVHLRYFDDRGYHRPNGGATVAYVPANEQRTTYLAAVTRCSTDDRYVRAEGRAVATDRLNNGFHWIIPVDLDSEDSVADQICEQLYMAGAFRFWRQQ